MPRVVKQKLVKLVCFVSEAEKSALENEANAVGINASEFVRRIKMRVALTKWEKRSE